MNWDIGDYNKAIRNYEAALKEQPDNKDLLEKYQILLMERDKLFKRTEV